MQITFEAQSTRESLADAIRRVYCGRLILIRVVGAGFAVGGLLVAALGEPPVGMVYLVGGLGLALLGPAVAVHRGVQSSWRLARLPTTFTLDGDGVHTRSALADGTIAWSDVTRVDRLPAQLILRMPKSRFLAVPTGDLPDDTRTAVLTTVDRHDPAPRAADPTAA